MNNTQHPLYRGENCSGSVDTILRMGIVSMLTVIVVGHTSRRDFHAGFQ